MAWTVNSLVDQAACSAIGALFNGGSVRLTDSGASELAAPAFNATAFGTPTNAHPSVAAANAFTGDASFTAGTIANIAFRNSGGTTLISGTVGVGSGDFQVSSADIPGSGVDYVSLSALNLTVSMAGA